VTVEEEAMACAAESPSLLLPLLVVVVVVLPAVGGFQSRKVVQILQGLPSGPRIVPGGSVRALEEEGEEDCAVKVSFLLDIVAPRELQMKKEGWGKSPEGLYSASWSPSLTRVPQHRAGSSAELVRFSGPD
jgi:hypothetical protein